MWTIAFIFIFSNERYVCRSKHIYKLFLVVFWSIYQGYFSGFCIFFQLIKCIKSCNLNKKKQQMLKLQKILNDPICIFFSPVFIFRIKSIKITSNTHNLNLQKCIKGDMTQKMFCFYAMPLSFLCPILTENLFNEHPFHSYSNNTVLISGFT